MFDGDYRMVAALAAVAAEGSFTDAARRLHLTQSAVSQRIRQLESTVGGPVLIRSVPLRLTDAGEALLRHWRQLSSLEDQLRADLNEGSLGSQRRTIAIAVNSDSLATWFCTAVAPVVDEHDLLLRFLVDYEEHTNALLRSGQALACITSEPKPMTGCVSLPIGEMRYRCVASPAFKKRYFPSGVTREAILAAPASLFGQHDTIIYRYLERHFRYPRTEPKTATFPHHIVPSTEGFVQIALQGIAHSLVPEFQALPLIRSKQLVDLTPDKFVAVKLYWHAWDIRTPVLEALRTAFVQNAQRILK